MPVAASASPNAALSSEEAAAPAFVEITAPSGQSRAAPCTALIYRPDKPEAERVSPIDASEGLAALKQNREYLLWLDLVAPQPEDLRLLEQEFHLSPLMLAEIAAHSERPKCQLMDDFYTIVLYAARYRPKSAPLDTDQELQKVVLFVGKNFVVTAHQEPMPEVEECVRRWRANSDALPGSGIATPVYVLLDTLVDGYFPVLDKIAEEAEDLEDMILSEEMKSPSGEIFRLKKEMLQLRRILAAQRDALNNLLRQDVPLFPEESLLFFQSVYDHQVRAIETVDTYRELLASAMDLHLSLLSNRMNQVMKQLTAMSAILMSSGLVAAVYGMNFKVMPELEWRYGYFFALGLMVAIGVTLFFYFRRKQWL